MKEFIMCTAVNYKTRDHYFGRSLDYEYSYHETVTITPRNFTLHFRKVKTQTTHYAMIGTAFVVEDYPLYYDAVNEKGLAMAGLNFPGNADYKPEVRGMDNVASFEFIPWVLGQCANLAEVRILLKRLNLVDIAFSKELPPSPLHWIISDSEGSLTIESVKEGLKVYENPVGVLTNKPPFDVQMFNLNNYMSLSTEPPVDSFCKGLHLEAYSRGMGALGLPGDLSSASRFVKAVFTKMNSVSGDSESESISQFFHILGSVAQQRGCVHLGDGQYEVTIYSSCCNTSKGIYYYTTYENSQITRVDMYHENLFGCELICYPMVKGQHILLQN